MIDEDQSINSEIIWTFNDVDKELLKAYPNGKAMVEDIVTIDGAYTWRVEFYPNGKDLKTFGFVVLSVQLINAPDDDDDDAATERQVEAECNFSFKNRKRRKHYVGKINMKSYELNHMEEDASFENVILKDCSCGYPMVVNINITQYPNGYVYVPSQSYVKTSTSTKSLNNIAENFSSTSFSTTNTNGTSTSSVNTSTSTTIKTNNNNLLPNVKPLNNPLSSTFQPLLSSVTSTSTPKLASTFLNNGTTTSSTNGTNNSKSFNNVSHLPNSILNRSLINLSHISSATPTYYNGTSADDHEDFKKKSVNYLYGRL